MALSTPIIQIIERDPIAIEVTQKVSDAIRILSNGFFHHLPVVENGRLVGILSTIDLLKLDATSLDGGDPVMSKILDRNYCVGDVMIKDVIPVSDRATVADAAKLLSSGGFHALPVMAGDGKLVGIVTTTDLVSHMLDADNEESSEGPSRERVQQLEAVYAAAQNYLASGMTVSTHEELERAVQAARRNAA